jgi:hypothetical protein
MRGKERPVRYFFGGFGRENEGLVRICSDLPGAARICSHFCGEARSGNYFYDLAAVLAQVDPEKRKGAKTAGRTGGRLCSAFREKFVGLAVAEKSLFAGGGFVVAWEHQS